MKNILLCAAILYALGFAGPAEAQDLLKTLQGLGSGSDTTLPRSQPSFSELPAYQFPGTTYLTQAQTAGQRTELPADSREMLLLSLSTDNYPVTPGDVYRLIYLPADAAISVDTVVESDFTVNLSYFGKIPARGLTFLELKKQVEQRVLRAYPQGLPSMTIVSNGLFQVRVEGEVVQAGYSTAWGLTRLSQVVGEYLTPYSSIRDVGVVSRTGTERRFDLFRALRFGEKEQDPYLRPGETVVLGKRDRSIQLLGEVRRPGVYQPLPNEGLKELIEYYGDGFTVLADRSRVRIERLVTDGNTIAESAVLDLSRRLNLEAELRDMDTLVIPSKTDRLPVFFVEGAIMPDLEFESSATKSNNPNLKIQKYSKFSVPLKDGETLYKVLLDRSEQIYADADLPHAYLVRRDAAEIIPVDLETLLFDYKPAHDIVLKPYDHLVIPFRHFSVVVTGAVRSPGTYSYVPNKTYKYYIDLAGGIDPERGAAGSVRVFDRAGRKLSKDSFLDPEGKVHVPYSFNYYFFKYFPVITSATLAIITGLYYIDNMSK